MKQKDFQTKYQKEVRALAIKHNISDKEVIKIYFEQFKLIKKVISLDSKKDIEERRTVKVLGLGKFEFNPFAAKKLTEIKKKNDERKISPSQSSPENGDRDQSN